MNCNAKEALDDDSLPEVRVDRVGSWRKRTALFEFHTELLNWDSQEDHDGFLRDERSATDLAFLAGQKVADPRPATHQWSVG